MAEFWPPPCGRLFFGHRGVREDDLAFVRGWGFDVEAPGAPVAIWQGDQDNMVPPPTEPGWPATFPAPAGGSCPGEGHLTLMAGFERVLSDLFDLAHQN